MQDIFTADQDNEQALPAEGEEASLPAQELSVQPDEAPADESNPEPEQTSEPEPEEVTEPEPEEVTEPEPDPEVKRAQYVSMAVNAGVPPLEMRFAQINSCYRRKPVAYRSYTYINSVIEGVIPPERYLLAAEESETAARLAEWNIVSAIRALDKFARYGRHVDFVTARCPAKLALHEDLYAFIERIIKENEFVTPSRLCLEFPRSVMFLDREKVRTSILGMKLLKVRTMISGVGEEDAPLTPLIHLPVDHVILAPWLTALATDRSKGPVINALLAYLRSMQFDVICEGVSNDEQIPVLNRADCYGYIPSPGYSGSVEHGRLRMPIDEAVIQKEEDI